MDKEGLMNLSQPTAFVGQNDKLFIELKQGCHF